MAKINATITKALERFPNMPSRTLAKYILFNHGVEFDNNTERIRSLIRYYRGTGGKKNRQQLSIEPYAPVKCDMPKTWRNIRTPYKLPIGMGLVVPDVHIPYHEPKAVDAMMVDAQKQKIDWVLYNGDLQDCQAVSKWSTARRDTDEEIEATIDFLNFMQGELPQAKHIWKPGNHEYRLPRYYMDKAQELAGSVIGSVAMEYVLDLENKGIEFLDYYQIAMAGLLPIMHGHEFRLSRAVNPARGLYLKAGTYALCSHHHTTSQHSARNLLGNLITTWSTGCLCDLSPDYEPYNSWCHGFAYINVEKNGDFEVQNKRILPSGTVVS